VYVCVWYVWCVWYLYVVCVCICVCGVVWYVWCEPNLQTQFHLCYMYQVISSQNIGTVTLYFYTLVELKI